MSLLSCLDSTGTYCIIPKKLDGAINAFSTILKVHFIDIIKI